MNECGKYEMDEGCDGELGMVDTEVSGLMLHEQDIGTHLLWDVNGMFSMDDRADEMVQESGLHKMGVVCMMDHPMVKLAKYIRVNGEPNVFGTKIPVHSTWNITLLDSFLVEYEDREVVEFMRYGWPANRIPTMPMPSVSRVNHQSAIDHPIFVENYLKYEMQCGMTIGPFKAIPFRTGNVGVSPLSTRLK